MVVITLSVFPTTAGTFFVQLRPATSSDDSEHVCNTTWQAVKVFVKHFFIKQSKHYGGWQKEEKPVKEKYARWKITRVRVSKRLSLIFC